MDQEHEEDMEADAEKRQEEEDNEEDKREHQRRVTNLKMLPIVPSLCQRSTHGVDYPMGHRLLSRVTPRASQGFRKFVEIFLWSYR